MKHIVIVETREGGHVAVEFASQNAAEKWRGVAESLGFETLGIMPILNRITVLYGEDT